MTGMIPKKFESKIHNIPSHLQFSISNKSLKYGELLAAIDLMSKEKCIIYDKKEFEREFGSYGKAGLKSTARKTKVNFSLRVVDDGSNIIFFKNDIPVKK